MPSAKSKAERSFMPKGAANTKKKILKEKTSIPGLGKAVLYARQSSGSTWTHGKKRQFDAAQDALTNFLKRTGQEGNVQ